MVPFNITHCPSVGLVDAF